jgi:hypothetical protein
VVEEASSVVQRKPAAVVAGLGHRAGVLGPREGVLAVGIQSAALPLTAPGAEDIELPVGFVGGGGRQDGIGGAGVFARHNTPAVEHDIRYYSRCSHTGGYLRAPARGDDRPVAVWPADCQGIVVHRTAP